MSLEPPHAGLASRRRAWTGLAAAALGLALAGSLLAPAMHAAGVPGSGVARLPYLPFCHQNPARSIEVAGSPAAVCARCLGLYLGGFLALASVAWTRFRPERTPRWVFFALCAPTVFDALAPWAGFEGLPNVPRFVLACPTGFVVGWFLAAAIRDRAAMSFEKRRSTSREVASARSV